MKIELYQDKDLLKRILCYSSVPQDIAVTEDMVEYLLEESDKAVLITESGQNVAEVINSINLKDTVKGIHHRVIFLVRTPEKYPIKVSELSHLLTLAAQFPVETKISWGIATAKEQDPIISLLIAVSLK